MASGKIGLTDLSTSGPENSKKYKENELKKSGSKNNANANPNANTKIKVSPRKFIGFNDFSAFDEMNTATYSKKEYDKLGLPPKLNENSRDFKLSPREIIHITDMKPYGDGNADTYRKYQLLKENSKKNKASTEKEREEKYKQKKTEKYKEFNEKCEKQNMANAQKRLDYEIKQKAKEDENSGKNRVLNLLNINSDKNMSEIDNLVNQYFIDPINKNEKSLGNFIHCTYIHNIIKETMAYFVENIFQYNTQVKEGWFQLMYALSNLNYNKKNMLNYKSYTEAVYKRKLLQKDNRDNHIETLQNKIGDGFFGRRLKNVGSLAGKVANRTALGLSITDKMNEHYNNNNKTNKTNNYYTSLEANFSENYDKIFEKIKREISSKIHNDKYYYKQANMVIMTLILLHKLQTKKTDFSTFDECFLTKEDVEEYLRDPPNIKNYANAKNANANAKNAKANIINIINDYLSSNNATITHVSDTLKSRPPKYIPLTSINQDLIKRILDTGNATNFELNIEIFNLNLFLLYTYYICCKNAHYYLIINKKPQGKTVEFGRSNYFDSLDKDCPDINAKIIQYNENIYKRFDEKTIHEKVLEEFNKKDKRDKKDIELNETINKFKLTIKHDTIIQQGNYIKYTMEFSKDDETYFTRQGEIKLSNAKQTSISNTPQFTKIENVSLLSPDEKLKFIKLLGTKLVEKNIIPPETLDKLTLLQNSLLGPSIINRIIEQNLNKLDIDIKKIIDKLLANTITTDEINTLKTKLNTLLVLE